MEIEFLETLGFLSAPQVEQIARFRELLRKEEKLTKAISFAEFAAKAYDDREPAFHLTDRLYAVSCEAKKLLGEIK